MGCGQSVPAEKEPDAPPEEPLSGQEPAANQLSQIHAVPGGPDGVAKRFNLIHKSQQLKEYLVCDKQTLFLLSKKMGTAVSPAISVHSGAGTFVCKVKKSIFNEAETKINDGAEAERNPTYFIYRKIVKDGAELKASAATATSRLMHGDLLGGLRKGGSTAKNALKTGANAANLDADADIFASVMRIHGRTGQQGATWMVLEGKFTSDKKVTSDTALNVLYTLTDGGGGAWTVRNPAGTLVGKSALDTHWRPPEEIASVPEGADFASRQLDLGAGVDAALVLAAAIAIEDFAEAAATGLVTDAAVTFGKGLKAAQSKMDDALTKVGVAHAKRDRV